MSQRPRLAHVLAAGIAILALCTISVLGLADVQFPVPKKIAPLPAIEGKDLLTGERVALKDLIGQVVVLDFWATWCKPCVDELPDLVQYQKEHKRRSFTYVGVSVDDAGDRGAVTKFARKKGINYPLLLADGTIVESVGELIGEPLESIPTKVVFNRAGKVAFYVVGSPSGDKDVRQAYEARLEELLKAPIPERRPKRAAS